MAEGALLLGPGAAIRMVAQHPTRLRLLPLRLQLFPLDSVFASRRHDLEAFPDHHFASAHLERLMLVAQQRLQSPVLRLQFPQQLAIEELADLWTQEDKDLLASGQHKRLKCAHAALEGLGG